MGELLCYFDDPDPGSGADVEDLGCGGGGEVGNYVLTPDMVFEGEVLGVEAGLFVVIMRKGVVCHYSGQCLG
jgi:hypothetical protein